MKPTEVSALGAGSRTSRTLLTLFALILGIETGAGFFEAAVVVPLWSGSLNAAQRWAASAPYVAEGGRFFALASPLLLITTLSLLFAVRRLPQPARVWAAGAVAIVLVLLVLTFAYYLPNQNAMKTPDGDMSEATFVQQARLWVRLNWGRQILGLLAFLCSLRALRLLPTSDAGHPGDA